MNDGVAGDQDLGALLAPSTIGDGAAPAGAGGPSPFSVHRRRLPARRWHTIIRFEHGKVGEELEYELTIGFYRDGAVGEIFLDGCNKQRNFKLKVGSPLEAMLDDQAELVSLLLQLGFRPAALVGRFTHGSIMRRAIAIVAEIEAAGGVKLYTPPAEAPL